MKFKYIKQFSVYIFEVSIISILFVLVMNKLYPTEMAYDNIERFFTGIVVYQGLVFVFNKNFMDAKKDMYLAYKKYLSYCKLYLETNSELVLNDIKEKLNLVNTDKMFLDSSHKKAFIGMYELIINNKVSLSEKKIRVECEIINVEHLIGYEDLKWKQSIILKFLK